MEFLQVIRTAAELGLGPLIAILVIYWYRQDTKEREARRKAEAERELEDAKQKFFLEREDKLLLIKTLQEFTVMMTELTVLVKRLNHGES